LLQLAAEACWGDIQVLLDAGLDLSGKTITRLRHDCTGQLDKCITDLREVDGDDEEAVFRTHLNLARKAPELGYQLGPPLARVRELAESKAEGEIKALMEENAELREAIKEFGRRKERWLRRSDNKKRKGC